MILETFRLNGALLTAGDVLVEDLGLTSARWQVLGALGLADKPMTVAQIGRRMGISRQAVQRLVNEMVADGLLVLQDNPEHKRSRLVALTNTGRRAYADADSRQIAWVNELGAGLKASDIGNAAAVLKTLHERLSRKNDRA
ncbi:MAG: helix-turn-helix domain-containing protein [Pseudomonadota bacterium]